jgi:hypothetical protein
MNAGKNRKKAPSPLLMTFAIVLVYNYTENISSFFELLHALKNDEEKKRPRSYYTFAVSHGIQSSIQPMQLLLCLMPITSKHLLSLMCRHLLAFSFSSTGHDGTP